MSMKIITWNIRGSNSNEFIPHARDIIQIHQPSIFNFVETKAGDDNVALVAKNLHFDDYKTIPPHGTKRGIWLFWKTSISLLLFNNPSPHYFNALFHLIPEQPECLITAIHAPSSPSPRHALWNSLSNNRPPTSTPWLVVGDLNEVTS